MRTLAKFNPLSLFFVPGLILWLLGAAVATLLLFLGPIRGFTTHTIITGVMAALIGFQLIIISFAINLYTVGEHDNGHSRTLTQLAANISHDGIAFLGILILFIGLVWYAILVRMWRLEATHQFLWTEAQVFALSFIVGGFQLISLTFILSQLADRASNEIPE